MALADGAVPPLRNIKSPHRCGGGSWCRAIARARSGERPSLGKERDHVDRLGRRFPGGVHMRCRPAVGTWRPGRHELPSLFRKPVDESLPIVEAPALP